MVLFTGHRPNLRETAMTDKTEKLNIIINALRDGEVEQCTHVLSSTIGGVFTVCAQGKIALGLGLLDELKELAEFNPFEDDDLEDHVIKRREAITARIYAALEDAMQEAGFASNVLGAVMELNDSFHLTFDEIATVLLGVHRLKIFEQRNAILEAGKAISMHRHT